MAKIEGKEAARTGCIERNESTGIKKKRNEIKKERKNLQGWGETKTAKIKI